MNTNDIAGIAIKLPDGTVFPGKSGEIHSMAWSRMAEEGVIPWDDEESGIPSWPAGMVEGFVTKGGKFLDREEAYHHALMHCQLDANAHELFEGGEEGILESQDFENNRNY